MTREPNLAMRASITAALNSERQHHILERYVETRIPELHRAIRLPVNAEASALVEFLTHYILHVPDFLDALIELATSAGIYEIIEKIVTIAQSYFVDPPELIQDHQGLHALIYEAYLAHRLMEEVNDRIMMDYALPLIPMDMTLSNLIVHSILGDEFANELDLAVHYSVETLFNNAACLENPDFIAYIALHKTSGWVDMLDESPCLAGDASIGLDLDSTAIPPIKH